MIGAKRVIGKIKIPLPKKCDFNHNCLIRGIFTYKCGKLTESATDTLISKAGMGKFRSSLIHVGGKEEWLLLISNKQSRNVNGCCQTIVTWTTSLAELLQKGEVHGPITRHRIRDGPCDHQVPYRPGVQHELIPAESPH